MVNEQFTDNVTLKEVTKCYCKMILHKSCLDEWLNISRRCPVYRKSMTNPDSPLTWWNSGVPVNEQEINDIFSIKIFRIITNNVNDFFKIF